MELGCDARGYSRAGSDTLTWYCAIVAGRLGAELNKMREVSFFPMISLRCSALSLLVIFLVSPFVWLLAHLFTDVKIDITFSIFDHLVRIGSIQATIIN